MESAFAKTERRVKHVDGSVDKPDNIQSDLTSPPLIVIFIMYSIEHFLISLNHRTFVVSTHIVCFPKAKIS